jgi:hypothetical protein
MAKESVRIPMIHHMERENVTGLTVLEIVNLAISKALPPHAMVTAGVEYDEQGPEAFLEWPVESTEDFSTAMAWARKRARRLGVTDTEVLWQALAMYREAVDK